MIPRRVAGAGLLATALALGGIAAIRRDTARTIPVESERADVHAGPPSSPFGEGGPRAFRLAATTRTRLPMSGVRVPLSVEVGLSGVLVVTARRDDGGVHLDLRLLGPAYGLSGGPDRAAEVGLATPFAARLDVEGRVRSVEVPAAVTLEGRTVLEQLLRTFQVVRPADADAVWTSTEEDGGGRFDVRYRETRPGEVVKEKVAFRTVASTIEGVDEPLHGRIVRSRLTARAGRPGDGWASWHLDEEIHLLAGGVAVAESVVVASLLRMDRVPETRGPAGASIPRSPSPTPSSASSPALTDAFAAEGRPSVAAVHGLRDRIRSRPDAADEVVTVLRARAVPSRAAAGMIHALELAGTPPAQAALVAILEGPEFGREDRLRATLSLGGVREPTTEALDALWRVSTSRADGEAMERAHTALLSLGRQRQTERLRARLAAATDADELQILRTALANTE